MPRGNPVHQLRVLLVKDEFGGPDQVMKQTDEVEEVPLRDGLPFEAHLYVKPSHERPPAWVRFVAQGTSAPLPQLTSKHSSAVLLVRSRGRWFALTFGYGRNLLVPEAWERDFGLKVTLNTVDPENLRAVDVHTFEEMTLHTTRQASRTSSLDTFGLNPSQDIMRAVTGTPRDKGFATRAGGSDGLAISVALPFTDLGEKCSGLLDAYRSDEYRERFAFIDRLRVISDPALVSQLDEALVSAIRDGDTARLHMAPPQVLDWETVAGFSFGGPTDDVSVADLDALVFRDVALGRIGVSRESLRKSRVWVHYQEASQGHERWSAYDCMVFETEAEGKSYVLTDGKWFEVDASFCATVNRRAAELSAHAISLPTHQGERTEDEYLQRAAQESGWALIHGKCSRTSETPIEFCDLFTPDRQMVHVKAYRGSSTLSHLFSQGVASAECLVRDDIFRADSRAKVLAADPRGDDPIGEGRRAPSDFAVVYAIIYPYARAFPASLPLLSKISLMNCADRLTMAGFGVSLVKVS